MELVTFVTNDDDDDDGDGDGDDDDAKGNNGGDGGAWLGRGIGDIPIRS
jgi:hypothetical protein